MKALLAWLDQWARNVALQHQVDVLIDELADVLDENVRLAVENAELKDARARAGGCSACGRVVTTCICGPRSIR